LAQELIIKRYKMETDLMGKSKKKKTRGITKGIMIAGIDIGGTNTQGVLLNGKTLKSSVSIIGNKPAHARKCHRFLMGKSQGMDVKLLLTGGGSRRLRKSDLPVRFGTVEEIKAIGTGGTYLSGKNSVFVVSIGTGTAFASVKKGRIRHAGGTGIGGGTIHGLSRLMLNMTLAKVEKTAKKGGRGHDLDLRVRDIVGGGVGKIPASATASNFGKAMRGSSKTEIASSLLKMVGEAIGSMSYYAAKNVGQEKNIIICGRVAMNGVIKRRIRETIRLLGGRAGIPHKAEYCAAIGAALSA
jgi:type II pantothenate kinase